MTAAATDKRIYDRARWRAPDGSVATWRTDRSVWCRMGPVGEGRVIGTAKVRAEARALLFALRRDWRNATPQHHVGRAADPQARRFKATGLSAVAPAFWRQFHEQAGVMMDRRDSEPAELRLGRVAAFALRRQSLEAAAGTAGPGPCIRTRRSLHDEPLTVGEIVEALTRPDIVALLTVNGIDGRLASGNHPLTQADIEAALAALCEPETASSPVGDPGDEYDEN